MSARVGVDPGVRSALLDVPRVGWIEGPSPVTPLPDLAAELGADWLGVKRDDLIPALGGATKVRKFDVMFAREPFASAERWATIGAIGSGHVRAMGAAAKALGKKLDVALFDEVISDGVLDNLAWTATQSSYLRGHGSRLGVLFRSPGVLLGRKWRGAVVVPPGATSAWGTVGIALGALELVAQVEAGELPKPTRVVAAYGSGGTVAGLVLGFGLAGWTDVEVHCVRVVEAPFTPVRRVRQLALQAWKVWRRATGVGPTQPSLAPAVLRTRFLGRGYGRPTAAAVDAKDRLLDTGIELEPVYTGKAFASILADAGHLDGERVLYWHTRRGPLPEPPADWRQQLPRSVRRRLEARESGADVRRRRFLLGASTVGGVALVGGRCGGYPELASFEGHELSNREAHVVAAAAEGLFDGVNAPLPPWDRVAANVDRFLVGMPPETTSQIHALMHVLEQGTVVGGRLRRLTRLAPGERRQFLEGLAARGGVGTEIYRGIRDLVMVGVYSDDASWPALDYGGPLVPPMAERYSKGRDRLPRPPSRYDHLLADAGELPPSAT